jgi:hypothetical protein
MQHAPKKFIFFLLGRDLVVLDFYVTPRRGQGYLFFVKGCVCVGGGDVGFLNFLCCSQCVSIACHSCSSALNW